MQKLVAYMRQLQPIQCELPKTLYLPHPSPNMDQVSLAPSHHLPPPLIIPHPAPPQMMPQTIDISDADEGSYSSAADSDVDDAADSSPTVADGSNNSSLFESASKLKMKTLEKNVKHTIN